MRAYCAQDIDLLLLLLLLLIFMVCFNVGVLCLHIHLHAKRGHQIPLQMVVSHKEISNVRMSDGEWVWVQCRGSERKPGWKGVRRESTQTAHVT